MENKINELIQEVSEKFVKKGPEWHTKAGLIAGGILAGLTLLDLGIRLDNKARENEMVRKQRHNVRKEIRKRNDDKTLIEAYNYQVPYYSKQEDMVLPTYQGLAQELYKRRNNHTNTWGGRRY